MKSTRTIILSMLVSFGTFALAGGPGIRKLERLQGYLNPNYVASSVPLTGPALKSQTGSEPKGYGTGSVWTPQALFGWMGLFVFLTILSDIEATAELADAFAILILISTMLLVGPEAFTNVSKLFGQQGA
jgi:hypothetical protein